MARNSCMRRRSRRLYQRNFGRITVWITVIGVLFIGGCTSTPVQMRSRFHINEHRSYAQLGTGIVRGQAFLRQKGGGVVTCAGSPVLLLPATPYFREMISHLAAGKRLENIPESTQNALQSVVRQSQCDAQGNFSFSDLPSGDWLVTSEVKWFVGNAQQGGTLLGEVRVVQGRAVQILLSDKDFIGR